MRARNLLRRSNLEQGALVAVAAALWLLKVGHSFGDRDQALYLLNAYREIDPTFAPGDWITWQATPIHPVYTWIVVTLHRVTGEGGFHGGMFALHLFSLLLLTASIVALAKAARFGLGAAAFALCTFALLRQEGLGHAVLNHGQFLAADFALPFVVFAAAAWFRGSTLLAGVYLGVSGLLHANYTVFGPLLVLGFGVLEPGVRGMRARMILLLKLGVPFVMIASPSLWHIATTHLTADQNPAMAHDILRLRSAHHYYMDTFPLQDWLWMAWLGLVAFPALRLAPVRVRRLVYFMASVAALAAIGNYFDVAALVRLYLWRLLLPAMCLLACAAGQTVWLILRERTPRAAMLALAMVATLIAFAGTSPFFQTPAWPVVAVYAALTMALLGWRFREAPQRPWTVGAAVAALVLLAFGHTAPQRTALAHELSARGHIEIEPSPPRGEAKLYAAIRKHLPADARLLGPPALVEARIQTRRAYFVDWKATAARGDEAAEWVRRIKVALGVNELAHHGKKLLSSSKKIYAARTPEDLAAVARTEGLTHIIALRASEDPARQGLRLVFRKGPYFVYAVGFVHPAQKEP